MVMLAVGAPLAGSGAPPLGCVGSTSLGTFRILVRPFFRGSPLPLKSLAAIPAGSHLIWNPVHLTPQASSSAEVTAVLVPASDGDLITLEPRKAGTRTEWQLLERPQVIAVIFGPQGLSEGKIKSLVTRNRELLKQLADYAEQSSQVESLVQALADAQQSGGGADSVLKGFSSQYGVAAPKLDTKASSGSAGGASAESIAPSFRHLRSARRQECSGTAVGWLGGIHGGDVLRQRGGTCGR